MKNKKGSIFICLHAVLLLWAFLFFIGVWIPDGGKAASIFAAGNAMFLFVNIPFSLLSFVLAAKERFCPKYHTPIVVLAILNTIIGIIVWIFAVLLLQKP